MKRTALSIAILSSVTLLSACHQDALKERPQDETVTFLIKASQVASQTLSTYKPAHSYAFCMSGNPTHLNCEGVFEGMMAYAKTTPHFKDLTLNELKNPKTYRALKEPLDIKLFNLLDDEDI
jgi:hypothetical protein